MRRIYSNYTQQEFDDMAALSKGLGFPSVSAYQKYCVQLTSGKQNQNNTVSMPSLIAQMNTALSNMSKGTFFIVSSLLPDVWPSLSGGEKRSLAVYLAKYVREHSTQYRIVGKIRNINQYEKL